MAVSKINVGYTDLKCIAGQFSEVKKIQFLASEERDVAIEEIERGHVNFTYRCSRKSSLIEDDSVFVKYTPSFVKSTSSQVSNLRLKTEYFAMLYCYKTIPGSVAEPLCYSPERSIAMFEFLHGYVDLEPIVMAGKMSSEVMINLAKVLGKLHSNTHVKVLSPEEFSTLKSQINCAEILELTDSFYFDKGYYDETSLAELKPEHAKRREEFLSDVQVKSALTEVRSYCDIEECLIHNDLHFNSIMVKDGIPKMTDFEFGRMGNPARDVALVVSMNIAFYYYHLLHPENNAAHRKMAYQLLDLCKQFVTTYYEHMTVYGDDVGLKKQMARHVSGLVGAELASRVLATPHIPSIQKSPHVISVETEMLECAIRLLKKQHQIDSMDRLLFIGLMLC